MSRKPVALAAVALTALAFVPLVGRALAPSPSAAMAEAAGKFLASLSPEQKKRAAFSWDDPNRMDWHFIPKERTGLPLKEMTQPQRGLALALLKSGLSPAGFEKAAQVRELETVLAKMENDPVKRDPEKYYFWVFGTPDAKGTWGWKYEGHHTSLNFTVVKGTMLATTPQFFGANPAEVRDGSSPFKGRRVLAEEEDLARALLMSFDEKARATILFDQKAPPEIVTGPASKVDPLKPAGLEVAKFSAKQKGMVRSLMQKYAAMMPPALAAERMAKVEKAGFEKIAFAWAGGTAKGDPHYYRLQGPTFLYEYDNTQNGANHVHTVWRDFNGDFGRDLIREHLATTPH